ncbi:Flp pilus assembly protein TadB [Serratia fonticola]|jgi:tight adherence protein B|uniref:Flp pilus assembly protein TadB n=1 Tax=Serratia fonticola TaxID=47917 RepID=A0A0F7H8G4_SERFO|nr:type II secretion system F family protein [Serratia fonticola]AKG68207.1 secretion system protein [Serratia fonticola]CAI1952807.1 Flp pilus assembly protein TadB [Serratia fonticola]VTR56579.1 Flp pilus assembly protein TadB [Serratia fonticola]
MYYLLFFFGLGLLLVNLYYWRRMMKGAIGAAERSVARFGIINLLRKRLDEWCLYAISDNTIKGMRGLIIAFLFLLAALISNYLWLHFDWIGLIIITSVTIFFGQINIGRMLHHKNYEARFPEALSIINAAVSAGNSIHQALQRCGQGIDGEMGQTFNRIARRLNLGEEPERVMKDARGLYPYREFYFFSVIILISIQRGGQLRVLISRLSRIVNNSKTIARRKKAMTSEARSSAKIVAAIPILFFISMKFLSPQNYDFIINDPLGRMILYYAVSSEALGMFIIWLLLRKAT